MQFENKIVVVTGGAQGIGKCIADEFLREGADGIRSGMHKQLGKVIVPVA